LAREITRRDFLDGARIAVTGAALSGPLSASLGASLAASLGCAGDGAPAAPATAGPAPHPPDAYPPALGGLRGSHAGSFEAAHALVAGERFQRSRRDTGERYDLVVVGAGISGLTAAWLYRRARPDARVLLIENHDDFGGHARRNELRAGDVFRIGYGGTQSIDTPSAFSPEALLVLRELGVELERFERAFDARLYPSLGLSEGVFFAREDFGVDRLVAGYGELPWREFAARAPLDPEARADLVRLHEGGRDYLPGLSPEQKTERLERISYAGFLRDHARVHPQVQRLYRRFWISYFGVGADDIPAAWIAREPALPGLQDTHHIPGYVDEPYIFHFPDGNASIARLLVRALIPRAIPGHDMEDVVGARADYRQLDRPDQPVRLRLGATAVDVRHAEGQRRVEVSYVREGRVEGVAADHCVLACWNGMIPYLCDELPADQKRGLAWAVKTPLVYVNALLRSWRAFERLGVHAVWAPGSFYDAVMLDFPVTLGPQRAARSPDEPMLVHLAHVPWHPEEKGPAQWRAGRRALLTTSFADFEDRVRDQLDRMLGPGGFSADEELLALTVNRWPHGYAREPNSLWDADWHDAGAPPWEVGRRRHGRIAIANSDAGASAYTDAAIDEAHRAVGELLAG
jgi:spermidine dehydrogenase